MPEWLREILISLSVAAVTATVTLVTIVFGFFVAIEIGDSRPLVGAIAAVAFLLFVVVPLRLWWIMWRDRQ
jgi:hypothetical protein